MPPAAPRTFSTMIDWASAFSMPACAIRTAVSAGPPGGNGTTILIGLEGNAWANARRGSHRAAMAASEWGRTERRVVTFNPPELLDHMIGSEQKLSRNFQPQFLGGFLVDGRFEFVGLLEGQVSRLLAFKNATRVGGHLSEDVHRVGPVADQAARFHKG